MSPCSESDGPSPHRPPYSLTIHFEIIYLLSVVLYDLLPVCSPPPPPPLLLGNDERRDWPSSVGALTGQSSGPHFASRTDGDNIVCFENPPNTSRRTEERRLGVTPCCLFVCLSARLSVYPP
jgi:hypothetical protein